MPFQIIRNDITRVQADAIVNTANPMPVFSAGTDYAVYTAAGQEELLAERRKIGEIPRGQAAYTPAFRLPAKYIIHTVGPRWQGGDAGEFETLRSCYENSLALALDLGCRSIAFPLISAGSYGFPRDKALQIAMSVIQPFVMEHDMMVILVVFNRKVFELSGKVVENVREYVDANYVKEATRREYFYDWDSSGNVPEEGAGQTESYASLRRRRNEPDEEIRGRRRYSESFLEVELPAVAAADSDSVSFCEEAAAAVPKRKAPSRAAQPSWVDINKMLRTTEKTFQEKLFEIIDERGLTGPQVYKNYISKQVYSKIQSDPQYHPTKGTALALCLSLHLDVEQTLDLIGRAGWTLSPSSKADLVVKGCIINKEFNLVNIDIILFDFGCPRLEKIK